MWNLKKNGEDEFLKSRNRDTYRELMYGYQQGKGGWDDLGD